MNKIDYTIFSYDDSSSKIINKISTLDDYLIVGIGNIVGWGEEFMKKLKVIKMIDNPAIAIGLGMIISLISLNLLSTAGGLIVSGYIALNLHSPAMVLITFGISLFTLAILNLLSRYIIIYGRRLVFCLLLAFILGSIIRGTNSFKEYI